MVSQEQYILKSIEQKLNIINQSSMTQDEIQKSFTQDELDLIQKSKYIRREGSTGNFRYVYDENISEGIQKSLDTPEKQVAQILKSFKEGQLKDQTGEQVTDINKALEIATDQIEKGQSNKYIRKYIGDGGKWVYVYKNPNISSNIKKENEYLDKIDELESEKKELKRDRKSILQDMNNDPDVEVEGGKVADEYGGKLNKVDESISLIETKIKKLNQKIKDLDYSKEHHKTSDENVPASLLALKKSEENSIEKSHAANVGDVHTWNGKKFKKQPNGKWLEVSEHGMTKKEHLKKVDEHYNLSESSSTEKETHFHDGQQTKHHMAAEDLDIKEHADEEVGLGGEKKGDYVLGKVNVPGSDRRIIITNNKGSIGFLTLPSQANLDPGEVKQISNILKIVRENGVDVIKNNSRYNFQEKLSSADIDNYPFHSEIKKLKLK